MIINPNCFTYGFEIEGLFNESIKDSLKSKKISFDEHEDGSVRYSEIAIKNKIERYSDDIMEDTELSLGVFESLDRTLEAMKIFENKETYFMDESCGLHLHIKPKGAFKEAKELFWDIDLLKKLEDFAFSKLCSCVKKRKTNRFCLSYSEFDAFYRDFKNTEKYRFARNHPSGTIEFRFFSPCEHKEDNIKLFMDFLCKCLSEQKAYKETVVSLEIKLDEKRYNFSLSVNNQEISKNYRYVIGEKEVPSYAHIAREVRRVRRSPEIPYPEFISPF